MFDGQRGAAGAACVALAARLRLTREAGNLCCVQRDIRQPLTVCVNPGTRMNPKARLKHRGCLKKKGEKNSSLYQRVKTRTHVQFHIRPKSANEVNQRHSFLLWYKIPQTHT